MEIQRMLIEDYCSAEQRDCDSRRCNCAALRSSATRGAAVVVILSVGDGDYCTGQAWPPVCSSALYEYGAAANWRVSLDLANSA